MNPLLVDGDGLDPKRSPLPAGLGVRSPRLAAPGSSSRCPRPSVVAWANRGWYAGCTRERNWAGYGPVWMDANAKSNLKNWVKDKRN